VFPYHRVLSWTSPRSDRDPRVVSGPASVCDPRVLEVIEASGVAEAIEDAVFAVLGVRSENTYSGAYGFASASGYSGDTRR